MRLEFFSARFVGSIVGVVLPKTDICCLHDEKFTNEMNCHVVADGVIGINRQFDSW